MSKFGYQPKPILPPDYEEFFIYQRELNSIIRDNLHTVKPQLEEVNKKSTNSNNGELRNRNRSVKSDVHKLSGRNPTSSRK